MTKMRFQIVFTYDCNLACKYCDRFLDVLPWPDTNITQNELILGHEMMKRAGVECSMSRVGGGEPLCHPDFEQLVKIVTEKWSQGETVRTTVATNNVLPKIRGIKAKYRRSPLESKQHNPVMISPADLGINPKYGIYNACRVAKVCGRGFDCHGFTSCPYAGPIGRVLGIDPYHLMPVMHGQPEICCHCIHSLAPKKQVKIWEQAKAGEIEFPTKTFNYGISIPKYIREKEKFIRLEERVHNAGLS